jgi:hypothetical protein
MISTGSNCNHWIVRDCTFFGATMVGGYGYPYGFFADGAHGVVLAKNAFNGRYNTGSILFLTNNDHEFDQDQDGIYSPHNERHGQYNVVYKNTFSPSSGLAIIRMRAATTLIAANTWTMTGAAGTYFIFIEAQADSYNETRWRHIYYEYGNIARDNTLHANVNNFVAYQQDSTAWAGLDPPTGPDHPLRGRVGQFTVTGNVPDGPIAGEWLHSMDTYTADEPNIVTGNGP